MKSLFDRPALLACLKAAGPCTTRELHRRWGSEHTYDKFRDAMSWLAGRGLVRNTAPGGREGVWHVVLRTLPEAAPAPEPDTEADTDTEPEPHIYPRYCLEVVPPPRQNDHRDSVYTPAQGAPARDGSQDFLQYPSRGHRC